MNRKDQEIINFGELCVGYRGINRLGYRFTIIDQTREDYGRKRILWVLQFDSGYIMKIRREDVLIGNVKDKLSPSLCGVGVFGYPREYVRKEYDVWKSMINRCYNPNDTAYHGYGALGVSVSKRWHRFDYFLEDYPCIQGYDRELFFAGKIDLDKDMKQYLLPYNQRVYSLETCTFLSRSENLKYSDHTMPRFPGHPVTSIDQFGNIIDYTNKQDCMQSNNISDYLLRTRIDTNQPYNGNRYYTTNDTRIMGRQNIQVSKVFDY